MPVDESILSQTQQDLRDKLNANSAERQKIKELLRDCNDIEERVVSDATPEDPRKTKKVMPLDKQLDKVMTPARRDEIYAKIMADKTALGI